MEGEAAVVLLSGGLDSTTCLAVALADGFDVHPVTFLYGQRHRAEAESARRVAAFYGIPPERHAVLDLTGWFSGSALTGDGPVPLDRRPEEMAADIPPTYVPVRNLVFLSLAAARAEAAGARHLFIGVNALDYSGYPDCRPQFISSFETTLNLGSRAGSERRPFRVHAPLVHLGKAQIVQLGHALGAPFHLTHSCYLGVSPACGRCDACLLRRRGFAEAGLADPIPYVPSGPGPQVGSARRPEAPAR